MKTDEEKRREAKEIRADIATAQKLVQETLRTYKKKKLKAKSKKDAEDLAKLFEPLNDYRSTNGIMDAYGWESITEKEKDRLLEMWERREQLTHGGQKFEDRVSDMMEKAIRNMGEQYEELLEEADEMERHEKIHEEAARKALVYSRNAKLARDHGNEEEAMKQTRLADKEMEEIEP